MLHSALLKSHEIKSSVNSIQVIHKKQIQETEKEKKEFTLLPGWSQMEPHNYWGCNRSLQWSGSAPATSRLLCTDETITHSFTEAHHTSKTQIKQTL